MEVTSRIWTAGRYIKGLLFWIIFMIFYFAYKYVPFAPLKVICATCESNFQHYKASFFSWITLSFLEYIVLRSKIQARQSFIYSRLATAIIIPWFVFTLWYIGPAIYGKMPTIPLEILYANIVTIIVGIFASIFEHGLLGLTYSRELRTIIIILAIASLLHYIVFTFIKLPWADVFVEPDWR